MPGNCEMGREGAGLCSNVLTHSFFSPTHTHKQTTNPCTQVPEPAAFCFWCRHTHTHTNTHTTPIQTNLISSGLIHLSPFYSSTFPFTPSVQLTTSLQSPRKSHVLGWILRKWRPGGLTARGTHLGMSILIVTLHPDAKIFWRTSALSYIYIYIKKQLGIYH